MTPLVTVVIPTYNSAKFIRDALESILSQTYPNIEIIVMDGASKDGTADIARAVAPNAIVISEPDRGQTHAINKGWAMAKGDIVTWLCADDGYYPETVADAVVALESNSGTRWVYGLADHLDENGIPSPMRHPVMPWNYSKLRDWGNYIIQPSTFLRKDVVDQKGMPDESLHYVMDYEYWLRIGNDIPGYFAPEIRVWVKNYRETKSRSGRTRRLIEIREMIRSHGGADIPSQMRWEWTAAYISEFVRHIRAWEFWHLGADAREIIHYPLTLPRALFKMMIGLVPPSTETRLRRLFVRRHDYLVGIPEHDRAAP
ncbi:MAG: glycosyltransferase [Chloroflexi bacterium]|nr:glycosyltransferase [Chloroflexota bacterium]